MPEAEEAIGELHVSDDLGVDFDLDVVEPPLPFATVSDEHYFSPEGTLVMPSPPDDEIDAVVSTYVGGEEVPEAQPEEASHDDEPMVDFDLDMGSSATQTVVNTMSDMSGTEMVMAPHLTTDSTDVDNPKMVETMVNVGAMDVDSLEFDVNLTDSVL